MGSSFPVKLDQFYLSLLFFAQITRMKIENNSILFPIWDGASDCKRFRVNDHF